MWLKPEMLMVGDFLTQDQTMRSLFMLSCQTFRSQRLTEVHIYLAAQRTVTPAMFSLL